MINYGEPITDVLRREGLSTGVLMNLAHTLLFGAFDYKKSNLIIAGGAVRDILNGRPVKDIDIFVNIDIDELSDKEPCLFATQCRKAAQVLGGTIKFNTTDPQYHCLDIADIIVEGLPPIQIIGLCDINPVDDIPLYDFGLSQCFVTTFAGPFYTTAYMSDLTCSTITYTRLLTNGNLDTTDLFALRRSYNRLCRLQAKYKDRTYINCSKLIAWGVDDAIKQEKLKKETEAEVVAAGGKATDVDWL